MLAKPTMPSHIRLEVAIARSLLDQLENVRAEDAPDVAGELADELERLALKLRALEPRPHAPEPAHR